MINASSSATSYMIALDDESQDNDFCVDSHESVIPATDDVKEYNEMTPNEAFITIGVFFFVVIFLIFILPFFDS